MKRTIIVFFIVAFSYLLHGCYSCGWFGSYEGPNISTILRYKAGMEYPQNMHLDKTAMFAESGQFVFQQKIYDLDSGYYFVPGTQYYGDGDKIVVMNFTWEEFEQKLIPDDWLSHWEDFVIAESPFETCCIVYSKECGNTYPYDCSHCAGTNHVDTYVMRQMVADGTIWDYIVACRNFDTINAQEVYP